MMEKTMRGEYHHHGAFIRSPDHKIVAEAATGLDYIADSGAPCPLDVIREREEGIGRQGHPRYRSKICSLLITGKRLRTRGEVILPMAKHVDLRIIR